METDQILDLFNISDSAGVPAAGTDANGSRDEDMVDVETGEILEKGKKGWLNDLGELWDEKQYEEEYNLDSFLASMKG